MSTTQNRRVLSIQSHVVHGYVGNKSATFPLQVLGFEVDAINSVQFSNHTGYNFVKGQILQEKELDELFDGLRQNNLLQHYTHLLTGYIGNESFLRQISVIVKELKKINPNLIYVCDPVMGDNGEMYVPENLLPIYRNEIIPLADIITPNQYEIELLTEHKIQNENDVWNAVECLHKNNINIIAISSTNNLSSISNNLKAYLSVKNHSKYMIDIPQQGKGITTFTGTGDLFAALFLAYTSLNSFDYGKSFEYTINTLQSVIKRTIDQIPDDVKNGKRKITSYETELKLIQSKKDIEQPNIILKVEKI